MYESIADFGKYYENIPGPLGVSNTIEEILVNEKLYIDKLNYLIDNYMLHSRFMGDQMKEIFGNVEEIKDFHKKIFYPDLKRCDNDIIRITECFSKHITVNIFQTKYRI